MTISKEDQLLNKYDDYLDEKYPFESLGGVFANMQASEVLSTCDINLYNEHFNVWKNTQSQKGNSNQDLSKNQQKFVRDAEEQDLDVYYTYSGRGMYGKTCPAVNVDKPNDIATKAKTNMDNMGRGFVIYCPN